MVIMFSRTLKALFLLYDLILDRLWDLLLGRQKKLHQILDRLRFIIAHYVSYFNWNCRAYLFIAGIIWRKLFKIDLYQFLLALDRFRVQEIR